MTNALSPDELERISSWAGAIAQELRPEAPVASTPEGLRLGRKGSLAISTTKGWYDHEAGTGGHDVLSLIRHLRGGTATEAAAWAYDWLDQHPGEGELSTAWVGKAVTEAGERRSAFARQVLDEAVDILGTAAETYLRSRGLAPPYPCCVRWLPDARLGESALVGILTTADGEAVGVQLGYLDPQGRKSTIQPRRQLFLLAKQKAEQGAFRIASPELAEGAELAVCEGLEDALSIAQAGAVKAVLGLPGVGRFSKFDLPASTEVVVFRDGDAADSQAARQLAEAVDRWVLAGVRVRVTTTSEGDDANSILQDKSAEELQRLIAEAKPAALGFDADVVRLARFAPLQYEQERAPAAARHQVRVAFLDAAVKTARSEAEAAAAEQDDEVPYPEPISELAPVLDAALTEMRRYVAATEPELAAAVLWSLHAHLVHHDKVWLPVSPKLAIQAPDRNCGKSTLLEVIGALTPRPETGSSVTASVVFRLIEARKPSLLIDEADRVLRSSNDELIAVLNSSHRRAGAYVWRTEEIGGERVPCKFSTWAACAFAGIGTLPPTLQDRSIIIRLSRAKPGEVRAHLRHGSSPTLRTLKRKFGRWAADLVRWPEPRLPAGLHNRSGDNWEPLLAIAALAGGRWPQLAKQAALAALSADQSEGQLVALLDGIKRAFGQQERISTRALIDSLLADDECDWTTANRGRPINEAWLRERFRNVIAPAANGKTGSEEWRSKRSHERGYSRSRFEDAWDRYLPKTPESTRDTRDTQDSDNNQLNDKENFVPDEKDATRDTSAHPGQGNGGVTDDAFRPGCKNTHTGWEKSTKSTLLPDDPDVPDEFPPNRKGMPPTNGELGEEELL